MILYPPYCRVSSVAIPLPIKLLFLSRPYLVIRTLFHRWLSHCVPFHNLIFFKEQFIIQCFLVPRLHPSLEYVPHLVRPNGSSDFIQICRHKYLPVSKSFNNIIIH
ncbi:hypothetical protein AMTRI_Chr08g165330 [Amborella trichopoda]